MQQLTWRDLTWRHFRLLIPIILLVLVACGYVVGKVFFEKTPLVDVTIPRYHQATVQGKAFLVPVPEGVRRLEDIFSRPDFGLDSVKFAVGTEEAQTHFSFSEMETATLSVPAGGDLFAAWKRRSEESRRMHRLEYEALGISPEDDIKLPDGGVILGARQTIIDEGADFSTFTSCRDREPAFNYATSIFLLKGCVVDLSVNQYFAAKEGDDALVHLLRWRAELVEANAQETPAR